MIWVGSFMAHLILIGEADGQASALQFCLDEQVTELPFLNRESRFTAVPGKRRSLPFQSTSSPSARLRLAWRGV